MKTVELKLKNSNEETIKVHLRLTAGSQLRLKEKYNDENTLSTVLGAIDEIEKTIAIFNESLNYKNNDNTITDGEELYDLLVENGRVGMEDFAKIVTDIAVASGIITKQQANTLVKSVARTYNNVFSELDKDESDGEDALKEEQATPK